MELFSLFDIFLLIGVSQGVFLIIALQFVKHKNTEANHALSFLLLVACLMLTGRILYHRIDTNWLWRIGTLVDTTIFLFGPFLYLYVRRLTSKQSSPYQLHWLHFFPALLHLGFFFWSLFYSGEQFQDFYRNGFLSVVYFMIELGGLLSFSFYSIKSFLFLRLLKSYQQKELSFELPFHRYLYFFLGILCCCILFWYISFIRFYTLKQHHAFFNYDVMWIITCIFFYIVGFFSLTHPQLFRVQIEKAVVSTPKRMKADLAEKTKLALEKAMLEEKIFMQAELSLTTMAAHLGVSPNDLSWLLNDVFNKSFYNYINQHRIYEFIERIKANEHEKKTLLAIAMEVGFNSKSTFNKFFKILTNHTPSEYIKSLEIEKK